MMKAASGVRWRRWWAFAALCLLAAVRWMLVEAVPAAESTALSEALGCASAAAALLTYASVRRVERVRVPAVLPLAVAGALTVCGPVLPLLLRVRGVDAGSLTIALALVPVVVAIARPAFRQTEAPELVGRMWPGIAAAAGMMLLLPAPSLASVREDVLLAAAPVLTGVGAAWLRSRPGAGVRRGAWALAGAAGVFVIAALRVGLYGVEWRGVVLAACLDGLAAWLGVLALLRLGATRWSAQFVLVPLVVLLEGMAGVRVDARVLGGLGVLVVAAVFLLLPPRPDEPPELRPDPSSAT